MTSFVAAAAARFLRGAKWVAIIFGGALVLSVLFGCTNAKPPRDSRVRYITLIVLNAHGDTLTHRRSFDCDIKDGTARLFGADGYFSPELTQAVPRDGTAVCIRDP